MWWTRPSARVGPGYRWDLGPVEIDLRAELVAALLAMEGRGYSANETSYSFDPGLGATLRIGVPAGRFLPWLSGGGTAWFKEHAVTVAGLADRATLARGEAFVALGVSLFIR